MKSKKIYEQFDHLSSEALKKRQYFSKLSIMFAICGAFFAIGASVYQYNLSHSFPTATFTLSVICLIVTIPVIIQLRKISQVLGKSESV